MNEKEKDVLDGSVEEIQEASNQKKENEVAKLEKKITKQIEKKQEQRDRIGGIGRIWAYVKEEHKWENWLFMVVSICVLVLGGLMLSGFLTPNDRWSFIKDNFQIIAIGLTILGFLSLIYAIYPFFKPAFPEFKKITWLTIPKFIGNSIRVFLFLAIFAGLFELYEAFILGILHKILG